MEEGQPGSAIKICYACKYKYLSDKETRWWVQVYQMCLCNECYNIWMFSKPKSPVTIGAYDNARRN